jgi:hypothetical protein
MARVKGHTNGKYNDEFAYHEGMSFSAETLIGKAPKI